MRRKKIGILTGGGDCPGLNAVIRAVVKASLFQHDYEVIGILDGYTGLVENRTLPLTEAMVSEILPKGGTILGTSNTADPFRYAENDAAGKMTIRDRSRDALAVIKTLELEGLLIVGGDGTQSIALKLSQLGVPIVGIPKTIDNDLGMSIALRSGMSGGADVILIPELPYDIQKIRGSIQARIARGKRFSLIVVAEGAKPLGGEVVIQQTIPGSPDPIRLGGIGHVVAHQVQQCTGIESRVTVLGHLQRGGIPTTFDRWLATRFGVHAVSLFASGHFGRMVTLRGQRIESANLEDAVRRPRCVDPASEEVRAARAVGTCFGN